MSLILTCENCGHSQLTKAEELCAIWRPKYEALLEKKGQTPENPNFFAQFDCFCGHLTVYKGPMCNYLFAIMFHRSYNK